MPMFIHDYLVLVQWTWSIVFQLVKCPSWENGWKHVLLCVHSKSCNLPSQIQSGKTAVFFGKPCTLNSWNLNLIIWSVISLWPGLSVRCIGWSLVGHNFIRAGTYTSMLLSEHLFELMNIQCMNLQHRNQAFTLLIISSTSRPLVVDKKYNHTISCYQIKSLFLLTKVQCVP